ncbi:MAG: glycosyl hydrolase, partial [Bacteroidetes bacterium]|nr:glycosyl hydrolase [Bacteroidota bacterium]
MKRLVMFVLLGTALRGLAQTGESAGDTAWFIDGYHGGIYGHLPAWQTKFMVEQLAAHPDWKINLELEPESWDSIAAADAVHYAAFRRLMADQGAGGRIEYVNPAYGQSYLYNISGESVIRQLGYGMRKLREHFPGIVFSTYSSEEPCFTSALPQILRSYGFRYASLKNPNTCWGGYTRAYGGGLVNWIGPDGSSILTVPRYGVEALKPGSIWETIASSNSDDYVKAAFAAGIRHPVGMCLQDAGWNFGPWLRGHGYQPTKYATWRGYFAVAAGDVATDWRFSQEDVLVGLMWGSQVLQRIARSVRHSENLLVQAEKMAAMAGEWRGMSWPAGTLDEAWRGLLLSQHHDCWIVPYNGKPGDTWADKVRRWTGGTDARADSVIGVAEGRGSGWVRIYNTTGVGRREWVKYGDLRFVADVPPMGYVSYRVDSLKAVSKGVGVDGGLAGVRVTRGADGRVTIRSDLHTIVLDPARGGVITSWIFGGRELVQRGKGFGELRGNFYNDGGFRSSVEMPAEVGVDSGVVVVRGQIAGHPLREDITVRQGEPRVDVHLRIDWKGNPAIGEYFEVPKDQEVRKAYYDDRYKLLALFPVDVVAPKVVKNAPFDVVESRLDNTFYNRWDSIKNNVILDWVDLEGRAGGGTVGMALFTDHTTSYAHGDSIPLGLTVQYSGNGIFYRNYTVDGPTELNYALLPHAGPWDSARLWTAATRWKEPLIVAPVGEGGARWLLRPDAGVEVSSVRRDSGALVVRLFNAEVGRGEARGRKAGEGKVGGGKADGGKVDGGKFGEGKVDGGKAGGGEVRLWLGFVPRAARVVELDG